MNTPTNPILNPNFRPLYIDILRAAKILHQMETAHASQIGAFGLELEGGGKEMIDAPMLKQVRDQSYYSLQIYAIVNEHNSIQAEKTMQEAKAAGLTIPNVAWINDDVFFPFVLLWRVIAIGL